MAELDEILMWMQENAQTKNVEGMARFGINSSSALGLSMPMLRAKAKQYRKRHDLAEELWRTGIHEARLMASLVDDPAAVTREQMDRWVGEFDSWDVCDQCCINLFRLTPFAHSAITGYAADEREFVRRTAFVLIATLAVHDKKTEDKVFGKYLRLVEKYSFDDRNFVRKAVNWTLRQVGKRSLGLNPEAVASAERLAASDLPSARWIGKDALRELTSPKTIQYIKDHR